MTILAPDDRFVGSAIRDLLAQAARPEIVSLAGGLPATELLPTARIVEAAAAVLADPGALQYDQTAGFGPLRERLAAGAGRPVDEVLVTAGSQQALSLVAQVVLRPGDLALIEEPGYVGALQALRATGADVVGVAVDAEGLRVDDLADRLAAGARPRLVYVNPTFANPTGATLPPERWRALLELAERHDFLIVADDPYRAIHFGPAPPPRHPHPRVVELRSSSKILAPGLRVGWAFGPAEVLERVVVAKQGADLQASSASQRIVDHLLGDDAWLAAHLDGLRSAYRERRDALVGALADHGVRATVPEGGFFLWLRASDGPLRADLTEALAAGVAFVPGNAFRTIPSPEPELRLSFSAVTPERLRLGVERLVRAD